MRGTGSDIRAVVSLDDFEYIHGLENCAKQTRKFGGDMKQSFAGAGGGASAGLGRMAGQVGFALQDFSSVLAMGGKGALSRAMMSTMNNVQMLGMAFGPWGAAITAVGGAIGSVMLPSLLKGETAFERIGEGIKEATGRLDKFIERGNRMTDFEVKLGKTNTRKGLSEATEQNETDIRKKKDELEALRGRMRELDGERAKLDQARHGTGAGRDFMDSWSSPTKLIGLAASAIEGLDSALKNVKDDLDSMRKKAYDASKDLEQLGRQKELIAKQSSDLAAAGMTPHESAIEAQRKMLAQQMQDIDNLMYYPQQRADVGLATSSEIEDLDALKAKRGGVQVEMDDLAFKQEQVKRHGSGDSTPGFASAALDPQFAVEQSKKLLDQEKERLDLVKQIGTAVMTPYEKAQHEIERLADLKNRGQIDDTLFEKGSKKAIGDFGKSQRETPANVGVGGVGKRESGEWYQAVQESRRSSKSPVDAEKIQLLKQQIEALKKLDRTTDRIRDYVGVTEVGIA